MKKYILTIKYSEDEDQPEYITEQITEDEMEFSYGDIILNDYWDEGTLKLFREGTIHFNSDYFFTTNELGDV